ncbi:COP23 domain-containing protein [Egbenema bharatensis]|uniref:COP23 domain-containing protein n=1 Tax=Egbenema bharatensis TaxID=3463334 RepID=UPI003A889397
MKCPVFLRRFTLGAIVSVGLAIGTSVPVSAQEYNLNLNGTPINERLDHTDDYLVEDNSYVDVYRFEGRAGQQVIIHMSSQEIDPYLLLLDPGGNVIAQDDDGGGGLDAQLDVVLPVNGVYTVYANSYRGGQTGAYTLRATSPGSSPPSSVSTVPNSIPSNASGSSTATQSRYFCDTSSDRLPITMARSRHTGQIFPLIQWTSDWAPAPFTPAERCQIISSRLQEIHSRSDRLILTAGTLNGQPVVCAANSQDEARRGICSANGLLITTQHRQDAEDLIRGLRSSFTQIVAGTRPDILPATAEPSNGTVPYVDLSDF